MLPLFLNRLGWPLGGRHSEPAGRPVLEGHLPRASTAQFLRSAARVRTTPPASDRAVRLIPDTTSPKTSSHQRLQHSWIPLHIPLLLRAHNAAGYGSPNLPSPPQLILTAPTRPRRDRRRATGARPQLPDARCRATTCRRLLRPCPTTKEPPRIKCIQEAPRCE